MSVSYSKWVRVGTSVIRNFILWQTKSIIIGWSGEVMVPDKQGSDNRGCTVLTIFWLAFHCLCICFQLWVCEGQGVHPWPGDIKAYKKELKKKVLKWISNFFIDESYLFIVWLLNISIFIQSVPVSFMEVLSFWEGNATRVILFVDHLYRHTLKTLTAQQRILI